MSDIVLHIGFLKTASTTLQMQYFPSLDGVNFIHRSTVPEVSRFIRYVTSKNPAYLDPRGGRELLGSYVDETRLNLVSAENLSGQLLAAIGTPGLDFRLQILQNMAAIYPEARVFLMIRRQDHYAQSLYREYLRQGGTEGVTRFLGGPDSGRPPILATDSFLYRPYVDSVRELFPAGMLVLAFEEFVDNQARFLEKLAAFLRVSDGNRELSRSNVTRLGNVGLEISRYLNRLFRSQLNPGGLLPGIPVRKGGRTGLVSPVKLLHNNWPVKGGISPGSRLARTARWMLETCREDNRALDEQYSLGLSEYGYW